MTTITPELLTELLTELEAQARAATPGPWETEKDWVWANGPAGGHVASLHMPLAEADATFIAAAHPGVVLALIARIRALEADNKRLIELYRALPK